MIHTHPKQPDPIATLEACYRVEQPAADWLRGVIESLRWLDDGLGVFGFTYSINNELELRPDGIVEVGCNPAVSAKLNLAFQSSRDFNRAAYLERNVGAASEMPGFIGSPVDLACREEGVFDSWGINGRNWDRQNVVVIANRQVQASPSDSMTMLLNRLAVHLSASIRLNRRLRSVDVAPEADAILSPDGRVEHTTDNAKSPSALQALSSATRAIELARGSLRGSRPDAAVGLWKSRVAGRWSLVDHIERDGKRYVLARENVSEVDLPLELSGRERQVVAAAALGRSNKEIAYELGLAHATVRVLLFRAARKLGARDRGEAIERFVGRARPSPEA